MPMSVVRCAVVKILFIGNFGYSLHVYCQIILYIIVATNVVRLKAVPLFQVTHFKCFIVLILF